jgi:hypothetical protein
LNHGAQRLPQGISIGEWTQALEVSPNVLHRSGCFPEKVKQRWVQGRVVKLVRKIGQQVLEIDFLIGTCSALKKSGCCRPLTGIPRSAGESKKK